MSLLVLSTAMSLLLTISMLGILARQFFLWYHAYKTGSFVILMYAIAFTIMSITFTIALFLDMYNFSNKPEEVVTPASEVVFPDLEANWLLFMFHLLYHYSDLFSYVLIWGATSLLLLHYRKRLGMLKFWVIISLPLIYYLSTLVDMTGLYEPHSDSEIFFYSLYVSLNSTVGGLLFGIAFIIIANRIDNQNIKWYMTIAACGFILLYTSSQITLVSASYPPFGIVTLLFSGLSAYLLLIGLYSTAVSLSQHAQLRKSIRKSIDEQDFKLLDHLGMSEVQRDIDKRITPLIKRYSEQMKAETAVDLSVSEEEVKQYMYEILKDLKK